MDEPQQDESKPVLPYAHRQYQPLPVGLQAILGTLATIAIMAMSVVAGGFLSLFGHAAGDGGMFTVLGVCAAIMLYLGIRKARSVGVDADSRGWVIGIYLGLGIGMLLWGYCGVFLFSLNHMYG